MSAYVYFVQSGDCGPIKIGYSALPPERLSSLQVGNPNRLTLLLCIPGTRDDEAELHRQLAEHRVGGEWFSPHPVLLALIEDLRNGARIPERPRIGGSTPDLTVFGPAPIRNMNHDDLREVVSDFLRRQFPGTAKGASDLANLTGVNARTAATWLSGRVAPDALHALVLMEVLPGFRGLIERLCNIDLSRDPILDRAMDVAIAEFRRVEAECARAGE